MTPSSVSDTPSGAPSSLWKVGSLAYTRNGLIVLFSWLLWGDFAWSLRDRAIYVLMQLMLQKYEVSDTVNALLVGTVPASIGLILGPIISYCSDRHRGARGRRIPYLIFSAPLVALSTIGLGLSPVLGEMLHKALGNDSPGFYPSVVIVISLWWLLYDVASTITYAVFGALVNDVVPSSVMGRFYGLFRIISLIVGIIFNYWLLSKAENHSAALFITVGVIFGVGVTSMCFNIREGTYGPPPLAEGVGFGRFLLSAKLYFKECFTHPYYLWFFAGSNLAMLAFSPVNLFSVFYAKSLGMSTATYGLTIAITYGISLAITYFLGVLADRFHPLRVGIAALVLYGATVLWGGFCVRGQTAFAVALIAHGVLSGCYFTGAASLGQRLLPQSTFAQFASAGGIIYSLLNIVLPLLLGKMLDFSGHNYRLTFFAGAALSILAILCLGRVHRYWTKYGGPGNYVAPE